MKAERDNRRITVPYSTLALDGDGW